MNAETMARAARWLANGYPPVPILRHDAPMSVERKGKPIKQSPGKQPHGLLWNRKDTAIYGATPATIAGWKRLRDLDDYPGLGIACGNPVGADVDIYEPGLAEEIEALVVEHLGATPLRRVGQALKVLLLYRASGEPITKAMTEVFVKGELKAQLEVMGQGQQVVGYGIHPTGVSYTWGEATPDTIPVAELPAVTQEQVTALIAAAEIRIRVAGYKTKAEIEAESAPAPRANLKGKLDTSGANPFRMANDAALQAPERWVPVLFGQDAYCDNRGVWRVPSSAIGRDREEDISISPSGIVDFGEHDMGDAKRGKRTAIDLVMEHGGAADATAAARWLADLLGIEIKIRGRKKAKTPAPELEEECDRWNEDLHRNKQGESRDIIHNVALILRKDDRFKGRLRFNQMLEAVEAQGLPWRGGGWDPWTDADDIFLADWSQQRHCYVKRPTCAAAVQIVARDICHHPIRERLNSFTWDGTPRLGTWLTTYLGVADTAYAQAVGRAWLISAVARVFQPGCRADHCLILEGPQGVGKSTAAATIALEDAWFADEISDLGNKDAAQDLRGKWVIELGELSAMKRSEVERTKAFFSRRVDHYRPSYGIRSQDFPRQCMFIGSTNADAYLGDETGGRRFWPVKVGAIDIAKLTRDRDQLWAEAVGAYLAGEEWWLNNETEQKARVEQENRRIVDPWESVILDWCVGKAEVTVGEILAWVGMDVALQGQADMNRVARVLRANNWERARARRNGSLTWVYRRGAGPDVPPSGNKAAEVGTTGNGNAAEMLDVPSVPSVPSKFGMHMSAQAPDAVAETSGNTGNTGNTRTNAGFSVPGNGVQSGNGAARSGHTPAWDDLDHWRFCLGRAKTWPDRTAITIAWAKAAGAKVDTTNDNISVTLPGDLKPGLALAELRRLTGRAMKVLT